MITKEEVKHIAKLARLGLSEKEMGKFQKEISSILDYIEKLKKVDVSRIEPTSRSLLLENVMREDKARSAKLEVRKKIIEQVPETKNGYLKVKPILKS